MISRYSRMEKLGNVSLTDIRRASVCVVGAGALGNEVVKSLVLYGVGRLTIVDNDRVVTSNLGRCALFTEKDAEQHAYKADALSRSVSALNPDSIVAPLKIRAQQIDYSFFATQDVIIGCVDNIETRLFLDSVCFEKRIPYIDGGVEGMFGRVQVVVPPMTACYTCTINGTHSDVLDRRFGCDGEERSLPSRLIPSEPCIVSAVASIQ
ncbi:MAG: ThiF family adenylyltransferase, partial [Methanomassiliicoccales archaeon]